MEHLDNKCDHSQFSLCVSGNNPNVCAMQRTDEMMERHNTTNSPTLSGNVQALHIYLYMLYVPMYVQVCHKATSWEATGPVGLQLHIAPI